MDSLWPVTPSSDSEFDDILMAYLLFKRKKRTLKRTKWITPFRLNREILGSFYKLLPQLNDTEFRQYLRVTRPQFDEIHDFIRSTIRKKHTFFRAPIPTEEKLAVCLRFLASGTTFRDLGFQFRLGESTISEAVKSVCKAIWEIMQPIFMPEPTEEFWLARAEEFTQKLQFPNCMSAIDGKHITMRKPLRSGSNYFNYKQSFSIILMAAIDANYKFSFIDIGMKGRFSDEHTFIKSNLGKKLLSGTLKIPQPEPLTPEGEPAPYLFVADEAFPLMTNLMRPFPGSQTKVSIPKRVFNYRLSRARQQVECAFGILAARFRIFGRALEVQPPTVELLIKATTVLHNYLRNHIDYDEEINCLKPDDFDDAHDQFIDLNPTRSRSIKAAFKVREQYLEYFNSEQGSVPWQMTAIQRGKY